MMKMSYDVADLNGSAYLTLRGAIHENEATELKRVLGTFRHCQFREIILDLRDLTYIGSSGIGKFVLLYKTMAVCQGTIRLTNTPRHIAELLNSMRLNDLFEISTH